ncbi:MAG: pantoate--beta-alanine ligase [Alphaproteobacteria bacterium]|nr:pantoate--beta-alanine ligase [Alphaproteobacteria bacterium]
MITVTETAAMTAWSTARPGRIGFVPTMGFLHSGHVSLMQRLRPEVDRLVVSIFVNPLQFGPNEDLDRYPRDPEGDAAKCRAAGVDALFVPTDFYPSDFSTGVSVARLTEGLCGAKRPGHFDGVTTVVARLFGVTRCHVACFGEKDYQQLAVVRRMVRDLALPVEIVGAPLIRDHDGLALSSRNKYLTADDRPRALSLHHALFAMRDAREAGQTDVPALLALGRSVLQADREDYLQIVDADSLEPLQTVDRPARALVAAFVGQTRLIDNVAL